jgi:nucleoid-associated protein EbfC
MFDKNQLADLMKQAQAMQDKVKQAQEDISKMRIVGEAGGGLVKVTLNGKYQVLETSIDNSLLTDKEMLQDLVAAAFNDAAIRIEKEMTSKIGEVTGGINIPGITS